MPFYADYSIKRRTIDIRDSSPVQFIICYEIGSIVTLEVTLNDYINHRNVTFDWVQTEGTPVILSHPKELLTTWEYTDNTDKKFRFYIDKDTAREKYVDCLVYHTPISQMGVGSHSHNHKGLKIIDITGRSDAVKTPGYTRTITIDVPSIPAQTLNFDYPFRGGIDAYSEKLELWYSPEAYNEPYQLIETWTENYPTKYTAVRGKYLFKEYTKLPSGIETVHTSDIFVSYPGVANDDEKVFVIDDIMDPSFPAITENILRYQFKKQGATSTMYLRVGSHTETSGITKFIPTDQYVGIDYLVDNFVGYNEETQSITRLNPSGIGSST